MTTTASPVTTVATLPSITVTASISTTVSTTTTQAASLSTTLQTVPSYTTPITVSHLSYPYAYSNPYVVSNLFPPQPPTSFSDLSANPGIINPGMINPGMINPGLMNPGIINPGLMNPGIANPGVGNPIPNYYSQFPPTSLGQAFAQNTLPTTPGRSATPIFSVQPSWPSASTFGPSSNDIEPYSGGSDLEAFLDLVASVTECAGWNELQTFNIIRLKLRGKAREIFFALPQAKRPRNLLDMKHWLQAQFGKRVRIAGGERDFKKIFRTKDESLRAFATRLEIAAEQLYPTFGTGMDAMRERLTKEMLVITQFLEGLDTRLANEICRYKRFNTIEEALPYAEQCEHTLSRMFKQTQADAQRSTLRSINSNTQPVVKHNNKRETKSPPASQTVQTYRKQPTVKLYPNMRGRCFNCGSKEHIFTQCPKPKQDFCYICLTAGHRVKDNVCPLNPKAASKPTQRETA